MVNDLDTRLGRIHRVLRAARLEGMPLILTFAPDQALTAVYDSKGDRQYKSRKSGVWMELIVKDVREGKKGMIVMLSLPDDAPKHQADAFAPPGEEIPTHLEFVIQRNAAPKYTEQRNNRGNVCIQRIRDYYFGESAHHEFGPPAPPAPPEPVTTLIDNYENAGAW